MGNSLIEEVDGRCGGRPTIVGRRIEVRHVQDWLKQGMSEQDIAREYNLTLDQVTAAKNWSLS